jgi:L-iditol 2-dehydrogenase
MDRWPAASGEPVLVVGLGPVGLLMVLLLRHLGAVPFGVDPLEERRAMGIEKGCEEVCVPEDLEQWGAMGGVVLTACSGRTVEMALRKVEGGGWIGLFAGPREDVPVPVQLQSLYKNEVELIPSYSTGPFHMRRALELLHGGTLDVDGLFTHQFPIQEIQRAVELAEAQTGFKALLRF